MEIYIFYIVLAILIISYFAWRYKLYETVKKNSKCYSDLIQYNKTVVFSEFNNKISLHKVCNSKAQFDDFDNDKCIKFLVQNFESKLDYYKDIRNKILENTKNYNTYINRFKKIVNENPFDYDTVAESLKINPLNFRKIEVEICERAKLNPIVDVEITVSVSYVSPMGRNRYFKSRIIDFEGLQYILSLIKQQIQYKQSAQYQRATMTKKLRQAVLRRDSYTCKHCGRSPRKDPNVTLHVDHILPVSKGGTNDMSNLQTLCSECNLYKSNYYDPNGIN